MHYGGAAQAQEAIDSALADLRRGRMIIVVDDADRENEGDLVMVAEKATPASVNFMARFGRGLICVPTTEDRLRQLGIERMVKQNREVFRTDFQVSVDAAKGIGSGISAADRAKTIQIMASTTSTEFVPDCRRMLRRTVPRSSRFATVSGSASPSSLRSE